LAAEPQRAGAAHPWHHEHLAPQGERRRRSHLTDARRGGCHHRARARIKLRSIDEARQFRQSVEPHSSAATRKRGRPAPWHRDSRLVWDAPLFAGCQVSGLSGVARPSGFMITHE
jgi:hypothetical protein